MNDFDLGRGLRDLSSSAPITTPIDEAGVARRVQRGRAVRATGVTAACVAAVLGVGTAVWAIGPFDTQPIPPAETIEPTPDSRTPRPEERSAPDPDETTGPEPEATGTPTAPTPSAPPIVAVDAAGDVVLLDSSGTVTRTVSEAIGEVYLASMFEVDRRTDTATVMLIDAEGTAYDVRVSLRDGTVERLSDARPLTFSSADGRMALEREFDDEAWARQEPYVGYTIRDLTAGSTRWILDPTACECDQTVSAVWSHDSSHVAILTGFADGRRAVRDLAILPSDARSWDDALLLEPRSLPETGRWLFWPSLTYLSSTEIAVLEYEDRTEWSTETTTGNAVEVPATAQLVVLDARTGAELRRVAVAGLPGIGSRLTAAPDGDGVVVTTVERTEADEPMVSLHRVSEDGTTELIAEGYRAIAW